VLQINLLSGNLVQSKSAADVAQLASVGDRTQPESSVPVTSSIAMENDELSTETQVRPDLMPKVSSPEINAIIENRLKVH